VAYAKGTDVPKERSRLELEAILSRYGASHFMYGWDEGRVVVAFRTDEDQGHRQVKFVLPMPKEHEVALTPGGRRRTTRQVEDALAQEERRRWRALVLVVKSKLEAVESGIETFDEAFMPHIVLPGGETVSQWLSPQIDEAYASGALPSELRLALDPGETE
jgi:hypothetical protein